jgi:hypothetical protein
VGLEGLWVSYKIRNNRNFSRFGNGIRTSKKDAGVPGAGTYKHKESVSSF